MSRTVRNDLGDLLQFFKSRKIDPLKAVELMDDLKAIIIGVILKKDLGGKNGRNNHIEDKNG